MDQTAHDAGYLERKGFHSCPPGPGRRMCRRLPDGKALNGKAIIRLHP
jgi:hypothetical protein